MGESHSTRMVRSEAQTVTECISKEHGVVIPHAGSVRGLSGNWQTYSDGSCLLDALIHGALKRRGIMRLDYGRWMVWFLSEMTGGPLPPYLLEIVMRDGRSFYVHSGNSRDEESHSVVVNVWDLRAVDPSTEIEIKRLLDKPKVWNEASSKEPSNLHPSLSVGRLRCTLDDIMYVVEWWSRLWDFEKFIPKETARQMGFPMPKSKQE